MGADDGREDQVVFIRRAGPRDVPEIVRMLADDPLGSQREGLGSPLPRAYYDAFHEIDRDPNTALVVAEAGGQVVGTLQLTFLRHLTHKGGRRAQIEGVRVDRRWRGLGVGGLLVKWAVGQARAAHCHIVQLTTDNARPDARRFYERHGFVASHAGMKLVLGSES